LQRVYFDEQSTWLFIAILRVFSNKRIFRTKLLPVVYVIANYLRMK